MEYCEVMKQQARMCKSFTSGNMFEGCFKCPLAASNVCAELYIATKEDILKAEKIIMEWAKENPEKKYPLWGDWLESVGLLRKISTSNGNWHYQTTAAINNEINDKLADFIGIKPVIGE